ncbi:MAG: hypothetical protein ABR551_09500 [Gemmatimonadales bacterium]
MRRLAFVLLLLPLGACGGAAAGTLATRADSAGITIVTSTDASWREGEGWRINPQPLVQIGHRGDNDPRYDLVEVNSGRILPSNELAVVVRGHLQMRIYDANGTWLRNISREGDGPGEMRLPGTLIVATDTLFVADMRLSRVTAFTIAGEFLTSWPMPVAEPGGRIPPSRRLADGRWVGTGLTTFIPGQVASGVSRSPTTWYRISADLSRVEGPVAELPGTERLVEMSTDASGQPTGMRVMDLSIRRASSGTTGADFLLAGENSHPEMRVYTPEGTLTRIIRWAAPVIPVDATILDRMKQAQLSLAAGDQQQIEEIEARFRNPPPAEVVPFFSGLHLDPDQNIWVQEFSTFAADSVHFRVFHADGQYLGRLSLPPRHRVLDVGTDRILTIWQDDDDLEYLRVYQIQR